MREGIRQVVLYSNDHTLSGSAVTHLHLVSWSKRVCGALSALACLRPFCSYSPPSPLPHCSQYSHSLYSAIKDNGSRGHVSNTLRLRACGFCSGVTDRTASTAANQLRSPLLRLPGEIRNRIYGYAFFGENHTEIALLKTCKQIEHEAKPIYYSHITFSLYDFRKIRHLVNRTTPELLARVESIRTSAKNMRWIISLAAPTGCVDDCMAYASYLTGLRYWHLYGSIGSGWEIRVRSGIGMLMGRDVEVTFDPKPVIHRRCLGRKSGSST